MESVRNEKPRALCRKLRVKDMHTGITIEQLIATVARVDAKLIRRGG